MSLMRLAHQGAATQFGLGVSQAALVVGERAGYELRAWCRRTRGSSARATAGSRGPEPVAASARRSGMPRAD